MKAKAEGIDEVCPFCNSLLKCNKLPASGNYPAKLQWQNVMGKYAGKAHYFYEFKLQKTVCRAVCQECQKEMTVDSGVQEQKDAWMQHLQQHATGETTQQQKLQTTPSAAAAAEKPKDAAGNSSSTPPSSEEWLKNRQKQIQAEAAKKQKVEDNIDKELLSLIHTKTEFLYMLNTQITKKIMALNADGVTPNGSMIGQFTKLIYDELTEGLKK